MFPVGFRFPLKEGEASSEAERSPLLRLRDGFMPLPEGGRSFPPFLQKGTPMLFFIVHDVPGRVRLRARSGFSLRKAQVLADRLDAVGGIEGVRVNPRTGSVLLLYANDEAKRAAFLLLAVAASEQPSGDVAVCGENLPEPAGRPSWGPFLRYIFVRPFMPVLVRVATAVAASVPFILKGVAALCRGRLSVDVLDAAAIGISLLRRDFKTARLLTLLLGFGEALEAWTRKKSLDTLAQSLALDVDTVWVRREGREMHVAISELSEDDLVIVRTGSAIPVDGVVAEGEASVNQASMTGEPLGVLRSPGSSVYAWTVVEEGEIAIRPTGVGDGTRLRQIVRFIEDSEALKAGVQGKAERLADAVVPFSFLLAGLVWLVTRNPARFRPSRRLFVRTETFHPSGGACRHEGRGRSRRPRQGRAVPRIVGGG